MNHRSRVQIRRRLLLKVTEISFWKSYFNQKMIFHFLFVHSYMSYVTLFFILKLFRLYLRNFIQVWWATLIYVTSKIRGLFELLALFSRLIHLPFLLLSSVRFSEETTYNACLVSPVYNGQPQPLGKMWRRSRHSGTSRLGVEWRSLPLLTDYTFVFVIQIWNVMCFNPYLHICHCHWAYARHNVITKLTNQELGLSTIVTVSR